MSESRRCPQCDAEIPATSPAGLCPRCLLLAANDSQSAAASVDPGPTKLTPPASGFVPPTIEELAERLPQLEILELLGKGGMGAVYKARQRQLDRIVAVKILPNEISHDPAFAERFAREARALAKLNHPHIVAVYDFGQTQTPPQLNQASGPELCYFVMEFVEGTNLRQVIQRSELKPDEALAIVPQICEALQYAHEVGVVHRDIKPENILIDTRGRVKIADFGLAKLAHPSPAGRGAGGEGRSDENLTMTGQVMGTLKYMAPEQLEGSRDVDHRADIYSLGVIFYELLTRELPIGRFAPPSKKVAIDVRLDEVVLRALEKEPEQRYQHASEVKSEIDSIRKTPAPPKPVEQRDPLEPFREAARFAMTPNPSYAKRVGIPMLLLMALWIVATFAAHAVFGQKDNYQEKSIVLIQGGGLALFVLTSLVLHITFFARRHVPKNANPAPIDNSGRPAHPTIHRADDLRESVEQRIVEVLRTDKLAAIRLYRELRGTGLEEAKIAVETIGKLHGITDDAARQRSKLWSFFLVTCSIVVAAFWASDNHGQSTSKNVVFVAVLALGVSWYVGMLLAERARRRNLDDISASPFAGSPATQMRFAVPATTDLARQAIFHFSSLGYRVVEQQPDVVVFQRGGQWAGLWETDIRKIATRLTVRTATAADGQRWVSCDWSVRTMGSWVTKRDIRQLEAEGEGFKALLGVVEPTGLASLDSLRGPHFSRFAIAGAVWAIFGLLTVIPVLYFVGLNRVWNGTALPTDVIHAEPPLVFSIFMGTLLAIGAGAPIGTTIFGSLAIGHIKRSEGKILGLTLAFADAIAFPLLVLDGIVLALVALGMMGLAPLLSASAKSGVSTKSIIGLPEALTLLFGIPLAAWIDVVIARQVWRSVSGFTPPSVRDRVKTPIGPEQISLWSAIAGVVLPALLLIGGIVLSSRIHIPDGFVLGCFILGVGLELVAVGCGIVARETKSGKTGLIIGTIALLLWLVFVPTSTLTREPIVTKSAARRPPDASSVAVPPLETITSGIGAEFVVPAGQVATFEIVTRRNGETVAVAPHCGYILAAKEAAIAGTFRWTPKPTTSAGGPVQKWGLEIRTSGGGGGYSETILVPDELNSIVGSMSLKLGDLVPNEEVIHWGTHDVRELPANGLIGLRVTVQPHGLETAGGSGNGHIDWKKAQSATSTTRRKLPVPSQ